MKRNDHAYLYIGIAYELICRVIIMWDKETKKIVETWDGLWVRFYDTEDESDNVEMYSIKEQEKIIERGWGYVMGEFFYEQYDEWFYIEIFSEGCL